MPGKDLPGIDIPYIDKIAHVLIFCGLTFLWFLALDPQGTRNLRFYVWLILLFLVYGMVIEYSQYALSDSRSADPVDLLANLGGIALGFPIAGLFRRVIGLKV